MKLGLALSTLLSLVLAALLLLNVTSCSTSYVVQATGDLVSEGKTIAQAEAPEWIRTWKGDVASGDTFTYTTRSTQLPYLEFVAFSMSEGSWHRNGEFKRVFREGRAGFWGGIALVSMSPLFLWGLVTLGVLLWRPSKAAS